MRGRKAKIRRRAWQYIAAQASARGLDGAAVANAVEYVHDHQMSPASQEYKWAKRDKARAAKRRARSR